MDLEGLSISSKAGDRLGPSELVDADPIKFDNASIAKRYKRALFTVS